MPNTNKITANEYQQFKSFLEETCGILLGEGKQYLIVSRLAKLLRDEQVSDLGELLTHIRQPGQQRLRDAVIDAMTTNETSWFRDQSPFNVLEQSIFPQIEEKQGQIGYRVWSAACSSGQEPYTISITLSEYLASAPQSKLRNMQVVATDISESMLDEAKLAHYQDANLDRGLSETRKRSYFKQVADGWTVSDEIKRRVSFKPQNLLTSYAGLGKFDIIFCRNVLIYFSPERKTDILKRMAAIMSPGGYLFLGASETTMGYSDDFDMVRSPAGVFFQLKS
jgi:chemotaxis protein methyltransferase CheR